MPPRASDLCPPAASSHSYTAFQYILVCEADFFVHQSFFTDDSIMMMIILFQACICSCRFSVRSPWSTSSINTSSWLDAVSWENKEVSLSLEALKLNQSFCEECLQFPSFAKIYFWKRIDPIKWSSKFPKVTRLYFVGNFLKNSVICTFTSNLIISFTD